MNTTAAYEALKTGNVFLSVFTLYDGLLQHWFAPLLIVVFQIVLYLKTKNITLSWVTGAIFSSMYASSYLIPAASSQIIMILMIMNLGGILYSVVTK